MPGQWIPDPKRPSGWRWDPHAPAADPSPTNLLSGHPVRASTDLPYGHDDTPGGPPSPPLDVPVTPAVGTEPADEPPPPLEVGGPAIAVCPGCGNVVDADRLRT